MDVYHVFRNTYFAENGFGFIYVVYDRGRQARGAGGAVVTLVR